jgi:DNA-binding XRE family transcriptional regulator
MLAVVKTPRTKRERFSFPGEIPKYLIDQLKSKYGKSFELFEDNDNELMDVNDTEWYQDYKKNKSPGRNLRGQLNLFNMTQGELGKKIGVSKQKICDFEKDRIVISKNIAIKLADLFDVSTDDFLK